MKEKPIKNLTLSLNDLRLFTQKDLDVFNKYSIATIEQLLGATKGLTNTNLFDELELGEYILARIKQFTGEAELSKYRDFDTNYPTGLIIDNHEKLS